MPNHIRKVALLALWALCHLISGCAWHEELRALTAQVSDLRQELRGKHRLLERQQEELRMLASSRLCSQRLQRFLRNLDKTCKPDACLPPNLGLALLDAAPDSEGGLLRLLAAEPHVVVYLTRGGAAPPTPGPAESPGAAQEETADGAPAAPAQAAGELPVWTALQARRTRAQLAWLLHGKLSVTRLLVVGNAGGASRRGTEVEVERQMATVLDEIRAAGKKFPESERLPAAQIQRMIYPIVLPGSRLERQLSREDLPPIRGTVAHSVWVFRIDCPALP